MGHGSVGGAQVSGVSDLTLQGSNLALDFNLGYGTLAGGAANDALLDLSSHAISVGATVFQDSGAGGEVVRASGHLAGSVGSISVAGDVGVAVVGADLEMIGSNLAANLSAGGLSVGLSSGEFGLVLGGNGLAFEGSGSLALSGGGFVDVQAASVRIAYNHTGVALTGKSLTFAGGYSYAFGDVAASSSLQAASVVGVFTCVRSSLGESAVPNDPSSFRVA